MNIWLINHYAVPPAYYPLARQTYFAKHLMEMGHSVTIFAASTVHNSELNLITDARKYREETVDGVHYVYIRCRGYQGNGIKRIYNMCEFAWKLPGICKKFQRPDAIVATSMPPVSCAMGIRLARKYGCCGVAEIADLWPESIVTYGIAGPRNPVVILLRRLEKWIYKKADAVVFTMEGGYDYIVEQHWEKEIPRDKVFHINNGVDLKLFAYNRAHFQIRDPDLEDSNVFKVVYAGSIRLANGLGQLLDCARALKENEQIKFIVYGTGDDLEPLKESVQKDGLKNLVFKGSVEKKYIPYILSQSDLNLLNYDPTTVRVYKYGSSQNKLFEYLASGKPILSNVEIGYDIIKKYDCGISENLTNGKQYSDAVLRICELPKEEYQRMGTNAKKAASAYDFEQLTADLIDIITPIVQKKTSG